MCVEALSSVRLLAPRPRGHEGNALDFRTCIESQTAGGQRAPCRRVRLEVFTVDFVEGGPFLDIDEEHRAFDDLLHGAAMALHDGLDVVERAPRFRPDP